MNRLFVICLLLALPRIVAATEPLDVGSQPQLFIDDFIVEKSSGLSRSLHQPIDVADNPVIVPEHPWEHRRIPYGSVIYSASEKKFRCWYVAMNIYDSRPGFRGYRKAHHVPIHEAASICYAESVDGIHWRKPDLGLHEFRGSKKNNIVLRCPGTHFDSTTVMHTPHDRARPWKMISFIGLWPYKKELIAKQWGDTKFGIKRAGHYAWASKDGIHWEMLNDGQPVLNAHDRSMFWWDSARKIYVAAAKQSRNGKRAQRYAWSSDAIKWRMTPDWIHHADDRDHPGDEAEAALGFRYSSQYIGFCELRRVRPGKPVKINWELMSSRDGRHWHRPLRQLFFADGPAESWRYQVFKIFANAPIEHDGKLWIYYGGKTGTVPVDKGDKPFQAVGLAQLRRDGFVSLDASQKGGHVLTKPILVFGDTLQLNVAVSQGGFAKVAVIGKDGKPVRGFGLADCVPLKGDGIEQAVNWRSKADLGTLTGRPVQLRIELKKASLYSFQFEPRE